MYGNVLWKEEKQSIIKWWEGVLEQGYITVNYSYLNVKYYIDFFNSRHNGQINFLNNIRKSLV